MTILERLADIVQSVSAQNRFDLDLVKRRLVDAMAALAAGAATSEGKLLTVASDLSTLGVGSLDLAARGSAIIKLTEADDIHLTSCTTPGAIIIPSVLALSQATGASPHRAAAAIVAGYETIIRFGEAFDGPSALYEGVWPTYLAAPLGAAASACSLLGLNVERTADALAMALSQASGVVGRPPGQTSRWLLGGLATRAGCAAALAAAQGYRGDVSLLDGPHLHQASGLAFSGDVLLNGKAAPAISDCAQKPFCSAKQAIAAIQGFREELDKGLHVDDIERICVRTPKAYSAMLSRPAADRIGRLVNVAYQFGLAAFFPESLWDAERPQIVDARLDALMRRVEVMPDAGLNMFYPAAWPADVEIARKNGRVTQTRVIVAVGDPQQPLSAQDLEAKFRRLVEAPFGRARCESLLDATTRAFDDHERFNLVLSLFRSLVLSDHAVAHSRSGL